YLSGTVAAVREAVLLRKPGIAVSQYKYRSQPFDWSRASRLTAKVLSRLMAEETKPGQFWNVNLPHLQADDAVPALVECPPCTQPLPTEFKIEDNQFYYSGKYSDRRRDPGADVDVCLSGNISLCKIRLW
ncbi:MAG: 5'/3'-nucleotidase SurE, partial [Cyanobacteria bacterium P01_E01_bin.43]